MKSDTKLGVVSTSLDQPVAYYKTADKMSTGFKLDLGGGIN